MDPIRHRLTARLADDDSRRGVVHTLGPDQFGMYVHQVRPRGTSFAFSVQTHDGAEISLTGEVLWSRPLSDGYVKGCRFEFGVRLIDVPPAYSEFLDGLQSAMDQRRDARFNAAVPVEFIEPPGLAPALTRNIADGGAFIDMEEGLEPGTVCAVRVALPGVPARIYALGRIVRVTDDAVGLKFLDFHSGGEARLSDYLAEFTDTKAAPIVTMPASDLPRTYTCRRDT